MTGAVDTSPSTSVNRGSAYTPPALGSNGTTTGIPGRMALIYRSPGEYEIPVLVSTTPPDAALNKGKLHISGTGDAQVLAISDGTNWISLTRGANL